MANHRRATHTIALAALVGAAACVGSVGDVDSSNQGVAPTDSTRPNTPGVVVPPEGSPVGPDGALAPVRHGGQPSALRRLSRDELIATLQMLTGTAPLRDDLPEEQRAGHGPLLLGGTSFLATELGKLRLVVDQFATRVAPAMLTGSRCGLTGQAQRDCLITWSTKFAQVALRRPARSTELARYQKIFELAGVTREDDLGAVKAMLTAVFFSPSFLYRTELGTPVGGKTRLRALGGAELASRISYLATLASPDPELLEAANAGRLADGTERARQFDRLVSSERGKRAMAVFVLEWLGANERHINEKSSKYLTGLGSDFESTVRASAERAIASVLAKSAEATVAGLLSTESYLADPAVQKIRMAAGTGRTATGDTEATPRVGLIMHPQVLAGHTKEDGSSPFQIGVFLRDALLCESVPAPPPGATDEAKTDVPVGSTMRQTLDYLTSEPMCRACHQQFAPLGYAFLPFDPVGRWVKTDPTGKPWDLAGTVTVSSGPVTFSGPTELMRSLAARPQVHGCFAQTALQWAFGRPLMPEDDELVARLNEVARQTRGGVAAIFRTIVAAPAFANTIAPR